ncbi:MAG: D-isomer specific 2-hydroxyacid dehydrogenase NAD-binding protein [Deltaproteobacteria bacterium]|nr:D-isomer specific 2-hydroxyacid dehydrogenase NAD-binding protein [Deltaproteobacteria bacterium]
MGFKVIARPDLPTLVAKDILSRNGAELVQVPVFTEEELIKNGADADAALVSAIEPFTAKVIRALPKCRIIARTGIGFNNIDAEEATRQGIAVAIVLDASVNEVSDQAMAFLLAFSRRIFPVAQAVRQGLWKTGNKGMEKARGQMFRLTEQTLGIVGVGRIGGRMALKARAFGMRVLGYDPYLSSEELRTKGAEKVDFAHLLQEADYVSIHAPLSAETRNMFGSAEFKQMKPTAVIINTARGGIIDEKALSQALSERMIAGAGLDVTNPEPPSPDNSLLKLDQVLVTSHFAYFSETSVRELHVKSAEAIVAALKGKWPPFLANPEVRQQPNSRIR